MTYSSVNTLHPLTIKKSCCFQVFPGMSCRCIRDTSIFDDLISQLENNFISLYGPKNVSLIRVSGVCIISSTMETLSKLIKLLKLIDYVFPCNMLVCYSYLYFPDTIVEKLFLN